MTDGGAGALTALGLRIGDAHGRPLDPGGAALRDITIIDAGHLDPRLATVDLRLATDVTNPLFGPNGAVHVFGPQKGATDQEIVQRLDDGLVRWSQVLAARYRSDPTLPGAGAAGGLAFGLSSFVPQAQRRNGFHEIADMIGLDESLIGADAVVTGEARWTSSPCGAKRRSGSSTEPGIVAWRSTCLPAASPCVIGCGPVG